MKGFAESRPIVFELILIVAGFALALVLSLAGGVMGYATEISTAIGRILAGIVLFVVFFRCFDLKKQFSGIVIALPALLFAAWNIANHFMSGGSLAPFTGAVLILGLAPAVFEEVIFRGIFIHNLKANGKDDRTALLVSALLFGLIHLTNAVGQPLPQVLLQTFYATVIGLVFGAIYLRSGDLISLIFVHSAIDITNQMFIGANVTPVAVIVAFAVLMAAEAGYAFWLIRKGDAGQSVPSDAAL